MLDREDHRLGELADRILDMLALDLVLELDVLEFAGAPLEQAQDFGLVELGFLLEPARQVVASGRLYGAMRIALECPRKKTGTDA